MLAATVELAGPFKIECKPYTFKLEGKTSIVATEFVAAARQKLMLVLLVIVPVAIIAIALVALKKVS